MITSNFLSEFISTEREYYDDKDNNLFAFSFGQVATYRDILQIIMERYEEASHNFVLNSKQRVAAIKQRKGAMAITEIQAIEKGLKLTTLLHLEIESFYLFAKILIDKTANFIEGYFGKVRGCSLASHNKLIKYHESFSKAKNLTYPQGFTDSMILLGDKISEYRDHQIVHFRNPRVVKGTSYDEAGHSIISRGILYPTESEVKNRMVSSTKLPELIQAIDMYLQQVIELVVSNRKKSRFQLSI